MTETPPSNRASGIAEVRTFLIADIRGYTRFTLKHGDEAAANMATRFAELVNEVVEGREGKVIELRGDEALAVFTSARQALHASTELQDRFVRETNGSDLAFQVGIGLDSGEAIPVAGGYRGASLNLAARLCALAGPGEVLASDTVANLARKIEGVEYVERGMVQLKGFSEPLKIIAVQRQAIQLEDDTGPQSGGLDLPPDQHLPIGGFLGSLPSGLLVGRDDELQQLLVAIDEVVAGNGRLAVLAGEPGAGKTRLAQEVTLAARNRGFFVAAGSCFETREGVPYYPFLDVLATLYGVAPAPVRSQVQQRWPYLGQLLPEAGIPVPPSSESEEQQERLSRSVTGFVQAIAEAAPLALFLDDIHWADEASLELLQHLVRHTRGNRVLIVAGYRDVEVHRQHPLERILRDLHRAKVLDRIAVRRLGHDGTAALMAAVFGEEKISDEFASLVFRRTEGNPFFTHEVLRALVERGDIYEEDGRWERRGVEEIEVPESVRSVIGERLSRLDESTQEALHEASVLGQTFEFDSLRSMSDRNELELETMLEEALSVGIIRESGRDAYGFNHALTQQALYADLPSRRKRRLHLAAGEALEKLPESRRQNSVAELAWHFLEGDDPERALDYSLLAGDQAEAIGARAEGRRQYRTAVGLARELREEPRLARALFELAVLLTGTGENSEAVALLNEAAELFDVMADVVMRGRAMLHLAGLQAERGFASEANRALEFVEGLLTIIDEADPSRDLSLFYAYLSGAYFATGRYSDAIVAAKRSTDVALALNDDFLLLRAESYVLVPLHMVGRNQEAERVAEDVIRRAEGQGDLPTLARALSTAAEMSIVAAQFEQSRALRNRELSLKERLGDEDGIAFSYLNLLELHIYSGDWAGANEYLNQARATGDQAEGGFRASYEKADSGWLALLHGDLKEGLRLVEEGMRLAERFNDLQAIRAGQRLLAEQDILAGEPQSAINRLEPLRDRPGLRELNVSSLMPTLAWAYLEVADILSADRTATEAVERMVQQGNRRDLPDALRVKGMVLSRQERWDEAEAAFSESVSVAHPMPYPYAEARSLYEWGRALQNTARAKESRQKLEEALSIFQRLGAKKDVERTEHATGDLETPNSKSR